MQVLDVSALHIRPTLALLRMQLLRAAVPEAEWKAQDPGRIVNALMAAARERRLAALLGVAVCHVDGFGRVPRNRDAARDMLSALRDQLPASPWPIFYSAILSLLEVQDGPLCGGGDLSRASEAARGSAQCAAAREQLVDSWARFRAPPAPLMLARCHLHAVGTAASAEAAVEWLAAGAGAGDPMCCAELARALLRCRDAEADGAVPAAAAASGRPEPDPAALPSAVAAPTAAGDLAHACLRYAALHGVPWAATALAAELEGAGEAAAAALWRGLPMPPAVAQLQAAAAAASVAGGPEPHPLLLHAAAAGLTGALPPPTLLTTKPRAARKAAAAASGSAAPTGPKG